MRVSISETCNAPVLAVSATVVLAALLPTFFAAFSPTLLATFLAKLATFLPTAIPALAASKAITASVEARTVPAIYLKALGDPFDWRKLDRQRHAGQST